MLNDKVAVEISNEKKPLSKNIILAYYDSLWEFIRMEKFAL